MKIKLVHLQTRNDKSHYTVMRLLKYCKGSLVLLARPRQGTGLEVLEPLAVKVARVVLRGLGCGDMAPLPDVRR